ncbi:MAG: glycoside hydrolase family 2 TIM barrel-domain containing protein [Candidatus Omnitrophica bacterium]|nr:glycoside hydrolase family 2 TIM barrel-domain containing protein [Candidatus Omnitrophota bacterium]
MLIKRHNPLVYYALFISTVFAAPLFAQDAAASANNTQGPAFEVKQVDGVNVPFQNGIPFPSWERQERAYVELNGNWKTQRQKADHKLTLYKRTPDNIALVEQEGGGRHSAGYDDSGWNEKAIPGVENPAPDRYMDGAWYRRHFSVPADAAGKYVKLMFEAANYFTDVWVNGKWVGCHEGGYTPFAFDVGPYLNYGKDNVLAVRVDNIPWIPNGDSSKEAQATNDHNIIPYATGDWWNYGGITRNVYLEISPAVSVVRADVRSKPSGEKGSELTVEVTAYNRSDAEVNTAVGLKVLAARIKEKNIGEPSAKKVASGRAVSVQGEASKEITLKPGEVRAVSFSLKSGALKHWSPESPDLYVLQATLGDRKKKFDELYTQFGVREIRADKDSPKLLLNGKEVFLRGIARHEAFYGEPGPGEFGPPRIIEDFRFIKEANANFVRTAHYPNGQQTYSIADRMGLLVWEEIPVFWFGGPEFMIQKNVRGIARQMWLEMIYRDYNRPSVIVWGTCNECSWQKERAEFIKDLRDNAQKVDGTRLVAQSASGSDPTDPTQKECDIIGFTTYYGIFYGSSYYSDTKEALEKTRKAFPGKPVISTEYGIWSAYGDTPQEKVQIEVAKDTFAAFTELPYVTGAAWWTIADWHTMINEPQHMGLLTIDRKLQKPVYFQIQRQYATLLGDLSVVLKDPKDEQTVKGKLKVSAEITGKEKPEFVDLIVEGKQLGRLSQKKGVYQMEFDTAKMEDGTRTLIIRAKSRKGYFVSDFVRVNVDNTDEPPVINITMKDGDLVMGKVLLNVSASDDRADPVVTYSVDGAEPVKMPSGVEGSYQAEWDVSALADGSEHEIKFIAADSGGQAAERSVKVKIDGKPGKYVDLPYDHDWISENGRYTDGTGWDYAAEDLPASNSEFIYNGKDKVKFRFGDKSDGAKNTVECGKQKVAFAPGYYGKVHILAAMHDGGAKVPFLLNYTDGTQGKALVGFSDWWGANAVFGEDIAIKTSHHHEASGERKPGSGIYMQTIEPDSKKVLSSITLPSEPKLHIFAMTLEGEVSNDAIPEPSIIAPQANSSVGDTVKVEVEDKEDDIAKVEYSIDSGGWMPMKDEGGGRYWAQWDTASLQGINHTVAVKATDKIGQINTKSVEVRVVNKVTIIFPFEGASIYKTATLMVEPRANREVEKIEYSVDNAEFTQLSPSGMGLYTAEWDTEGYKAGSGHVLIVREYEKGGGVTIDTVKVTADSIKVMIAEPLKGHSIKVDKSIRDWKGEAPSQDNTATVNNGEFIWKDEKDDDTGNGHYTYPTNKAVSRGSDLREFRITWDDKNLYMLIKCDRPGDFWAPYRIIGIDTDGARGGKVGSKVLAHGDMDDVSPDRGCYGEIKVAPELACEFTVGIFNSYKGRIWGADGKLIASKEAKPDDTPGFMVDDYGWSSVEVAVPWKILGGAPPYGQTWRFVVGIGQQDNDVFREIEKDASEWRGGGGESSDMFGPDPDVFDLASPDRKTQEFELRSYDAQGEPGNPDGFAVIKRSYLVVTFSEEKPVN